MSCQRYQDVTRFAVWLRDLTAGDAKDYRDALLARRLSPSTINWALTSLALFCDASGTSKRSAPR